jgi:hypothetical protein
MFSCGLLKSSIESYWNSWLYTNYYCFLRMLCGIRTDGFCSPCYGLEKIPLKKKTRISWDWGSPGMTNAGEGDAPATPTFGSFHFASPHHFRRPPPISCTTADPARRRSRRCRRSCALPESAAAPHPSMPTKNEARVRVSPLRPFGLPRSEHHMLGRGLLRGRARVRPFSGLVWKIPPVCNILLVFLRPVWNLLDH